MPPPAPSDPIAFARWLDSVVPALFKTDADLARAVGVPRSTVTRWRHGTVPSAPNLLRLSRATGTTVDTLLRIAGYREGDR